MAFLRSFEGFEPRERYDELPWTTAVIQESATEDGTFSDVETINLDTGPGVSPEGLDSDPAVPQARSLTTNSATLETGWYRIKWVDAAAVIDYSDAVQVPGSAAVTAFATVEDVEARLGRSLTAAETAAVEYALLTATGLIVDAAGIAAEDFSPVPTYFKVLCVEKALGIATNPQGIASETLGAFSYTRARAGEDSVGSFLSAAEERKVREIANNAVSASTRVPSLLHDTITQAED